jgi:hypothetical protein
VIPGLTAGFTVHNQLRALSDDTKQVIKPSSDSTEVPAATLGREVADATAAGRALTVGGREPKSALDETAQAGKTHKGSTLQLNDKARARSPLPSCPLHSSSETSTRPAAPRWTPLEGQGRRVDSLQNN